MKKCLKPETISEEQCVFFGFTHPFQLWLNGKLDSSSTSVLDVTNPVVSLLGITTVAGGNEHESRKGQLSIVMEIVFLNSTGVSRSPSIAGVVSGAKFVNHRFLLFIAISSYEYFVFSLITL